MGTSTEWGSTKTPTIATRMRRAATVAVVALLALSGCAAAEADPPADDADATIGGEITIASWQWLEPTIGDQIWGVVSSYEDDHPDATITKESIPFADYEKVIQTQLGAGGGPDIIMVTPGLFPQFADAGFLEPLGDVVTADVASTLSPSNAGGVWNGEQVALTWEAVSYALFWNKNILEEAGVTPPTTPSELVDAARTITEKTGFTGFAVRHQMNEEGGWWNDFSNWPSGFGGAWSDGSQPTVDSEENIAAVTAFRDVYNSGGFAVGDDASTFRAKFRAGEVAMMIDNNAALTGMLNHDDGIASADVDASALPFPTDGSAYVVTYFAINANSKNKELARDWLRWFLTAEVQEQRAAIAGASSITTNATISPDFVADHLWAPVYVDQRANSRSVLVPGFEAQTPQIRTIILRHIERVLTQGVDPAVALGDAQAEVKALVGQ